MLLRRLIISCLLRWISKPLVLRKTLLRRILLRRVLLLRWVGWLRRVGCVITWVGYSVLLRVHGITIACRIWWWLLFVIHFEMLFLL